MTARIHWARIALLGIAFVTFHAAEAQVANETIVVRTRCRNTRRTLSPRDIGTGARPVKTVPYVPAPPAPRPVEEPLPGQPLYKAPVPPPQSALDYALQPERITVPIVFVPAPVPLPKPKPFILPRNSTAILRT